MLKRSFEINPNTLIMVGGGGSKNHRKIIGIGNDGERYRKLALVSVGSGEDYAVDSDTLYLPEGYGFRQVRRDGEASAIIVVEDLLQAQERVRLLSGCSEAVLGVGTRVFNNRVEFVHTQVAVYIPIDSPRVALRTDDVRNRASLLRG